MDDFIAHELVEDDVGLRLVLNVDAEESAELAARGHTIATAGQAWGNMQIVLWNLATGAVEAASDPRWKTVGGSEVRAQDAVYR